MPWETEDKHLGNFEWINASPPLIGCEMIRAEAVLRIQRAWLECRYAPGYAVWRSAMQRDMDAMFP